MTEKIEVIKIEEGARYAITVSGLPKELEESFANFMSKQLEAWALGPQKFLVLTTPRGLEVKFEKIGEDDEES